MLKLMFSPAKLDTITLWRVREQMKSSSPDWVKFTDDDKEADAQVILGIGANGVKPLVYNGMPTILLQLCYKTTEMGESFWRDIWDKSLIVGSYLNLDDICNDYVRFPMGYDPEIWLRAEAGPRRYDAVVFGEIDGPEEILSVVKSFDTVASISQNSSSHKPGHINYKNIPDERLAWVYQNSRYCFGLRRVEGFEMPVIEGAACGCIPIVFDMECYRHWFNEIAVFIEPEKSVVGQLRVINELDTGQVPKKIDLEKFQIDNAWRPFWEKLKSVI